MEPCVRVSRGDLQLLAYVFISFLVMATWSEVAAQSCNFNDDYVLRVEPLKRLRELGKISDSPYHLERTFLSDASLAGGKLIQSWMEDAGMITWFDNIGNVHGRVDGENTSAPVLILGSHLDTVIDAGIYDGALGIIAAIAAVKALHANGCDMKIRRPIELIAFSDEEGVRFQSTFLGSAAVAGQFPLHLLQATDKRGLTLKSALKAAGLPGTEGSLLELKYNQNSVWAYVEIHIEQGPILERQNIPLGVVGGIAGQTRLSVKLRGLQGHAGTVPMALRRDPMVAAAAAIVSIEHICKHPEEFMERSWEQTPEHLVSEGALVCTVGEITTWPGASNVIPGEVSFTIDIRAEEDNIRATAVSTIARCIQEMCENREIAWDIELKHEAGAVKCSPSIQQRLQVAARDALQNFPNYNDELPIPTLVSGAGHDAMMMAQLGEMGMLFVRCTGGVSHSPTEHVFEDDVWAATLALKALLDNELVDHGSIVSEIPDNEGVSNMSPV